MGPFFGSERGMRSSEREREKESKYGNSVPSFVLVSFHPSDPIPRIPFLLATYISRMQSFRRGGGQKKIPSHYISQIRSRVDFAAE